MSNGYLPAQDQGFEQYRKPTRRDQFLETMERIVPWAELCAAVEPFYPSPGNGRPPIGLERLLRIHFLQHWFKLADQACEEALCDSAYRRQKKLITGRAPQAKDFTNERVRRHKDEPADETKRRKNRNKSRMCARVEHVLTVVKLLWGFAKVRYRGLAKNANRAFKALALANIYLACHR